MRLTRLVLSAAVAGSALLSQMASQTANAENCRFVLGFQTVHDLIPDIVGNCKVNEHYNPANGDALQETTGGLLVWRKADNFTAFTDGYRTWVNGPFDLQQRLNTERFDWEPLESTPRMEERDYYIEFLSAIGTIVNSLNYGAE
ncbi:MAG: hypothetical protein M1358_09435 [Chloroflexi bacterium]|nr:hypothetical protein [Chloroflexota bacterium]